MKQYKKLIEHVFNDGEWEDNRTGIRTLSTLGYKIEFDLSNGFPATTIKQLFYKSVVAELLWFMSGSTNVNELRERTHGVGSTKRTIWDDNYDKQAIDLGYDNGYLGPIYSAQWRNFGGVDQLKNVIEEIKTNPNSRRLIVSAWNPVDLPKMALPPCHVLYRFSVKDGKLNLTWYQRSSDIALGSPYNIASYATLLHIVAKLTGYKVGKLVGLLDDVHIYENQIDVVYQYMKNEPLELPVLEFPDVKTLDDVLKLKASDFKLINYKHHGKYEMPMAV